MKILLVNKYLMPKGGAETYMFEVGKQLEKMGHEVQYFGMDNPDRIVSNHLDEYVNYIDFHQKSIVKLLYPFQIIYSTEAKKKIKKVLYDFNPDIVHLNNFNYQLTPSIIYGVREYEKKSGKKVKIVLTTHDVQMGCPNHMMYNPSKKQICEKCMYGAYFNCIKGKCIHGSTLRSVLGALESWIYHKLNTYRHIDLTVYPSRFIATKLNVDPNLEKNYLALHNFITKTPKKNYEKQDYVLYFGRFSKEKGLGTLAKACKELPQIPFKFAGSGELDYLLKDAANIENVGFQSGEALAELIQKARFTIIPSEWYENCPFTVLESLYYGTPVLGADIGGIPELIQDGKTGMLFQSGNKEDLKEKILTLWQDSQGLSKMTENCAEVEFDDAEAYCEKLINGYRNVLDK